MRGYMPTKIDRSYTDRCGMPKHLQAPAAGAGGPAYVPGPGWRDSVRLSRQGNNSFLTIAAKGLGGLTLLSSFGHIIVSGAYGALHFISYFAGGLALYKLPWLIGKLRGRPAPVAESPALPQPAVAAQPAAAPPAPPVTATTVPPPPAQPATGGLPGLRKPAVGLPGLAGAAKPAAAPAKPAVVLPGLAGAAKPAAAPAKPAVVLPGLPGGGKKT
jgi:hypothetical protein